MRSEIVGCIPFDTANVWGSGHWRPRRGKVSLAVGAKIGRTLLRARVVRLGVGLREGDHIQVVQENPEDLFGHIGDFFAPDSIGASLVYIGDERYWLVVIFRGRVSEVGEDSLCAFGWYLIRRDSRELCEDEIDDDSAGRELAWAFLFLVEQHLQQRREEVSFNPGQMLKSSRCGTESLQTKQCFMEKRVFVFLAVRRVSI